MIRLIASDLDGTLLQGGAQSLPTDVIPFIEYLSKEHGILFVAASGRQYTNLKRLFGTASEHMAFICENGSLVFYKDQLLFSRAMERDTALTISHDILSLPGCELQISGKYQTYLMPKDYSFYDRMVNVTKNDVSLISSPEEHPEPYYKISAYEASGVSAGHGPELIERHKDKAKCTISGHAWIDFVAPDVNKGTALEKLLHHLGYNASECAAFGDNYNDIEMLSAVKYGYIMNNAKEELRAQFHYYCDDVVDAIKALLNIK